MTKLTHKEFSSRGGKVTAKKFTKEQRIKWGRKGGKIATEMLTKAQLKARARNGGLKKALNAKKTK